MCHQCEACHVLIEQKDGEFIELSARVLVADEGSDQDATHSAIGDYCDRCLRNGAALADILKGADWKLSLPEQANVPSEVRVNRRPSDDAFRFFYGGTIELLRLSRVDALRVASDIVQLAEGRDVEKTGESI